MGDDGQEKDNESLIHLFLSFFNSLLYSPFLHLRHTQSHATATTTASHQSHTHTVNMSPFSKSWLFPDDGHTSETWHSVWPLHVAHKKNKCACNSFIISKCIMYTCLFYFTNIQFSPSLSLILVIPILPNFYVFFALLLSSTPSPRLPSSKISFTSFIPMLFLSLNKETGER